MKFLRQSTAQNVPIGPFVLNSDGNTTLANLTIAQADLQLSKAGGNFSQSNNSAGAPHLKDGWYSAPFDTTDTNTLGMLTLEVVTGSALPVWHEMTVLPAAIYDALIAGNQSLLVALGNVAHGGTGASVNFNLGINGNWTGNHTGNQTGNLVGSVNGNVTGNVNGSVLGNVGNITQTGINYIVDQVWDETINGANHGTGTTAGGRLLRLQDYGNYMYGAVWLDTNSANTGTTFGTDGTFLNPVNTLARALTVAAAATQPLKRLQMLSGSSITLASTYSGWVIDGDSYALALGGQDVSGTVFKHFGPLTGTATGTVPVFDTGLVGNVTLPPCVLLNIGLAGTLTVGSAGDFLLKDCHSQVAGSSTPTIDLGAAVGNTTMSIRRWSGGLTLNNVQSGDVISVDAVSGGNITINGNGGTVHVRGMVNVVDNSSSTVSITKTQALSTPEIASVANATLSSSHGAGSWATATGFSTHSASDVWAVATRVLTAGTNIVLAKGTGVTGFNDLSADQVNSEVDTALADYDGPTNAEMEARTLVAASYATAASIAALNNLSSSDVQGILTSYALPESYAADGGNFTVAQGLYEICQFITEFSIASTTYTVKKRDGSTTAFTLTLDDATNPTGITRST